MSTYIGMFIDEGDRFDVHSDDNELSILCHIGTSTNAACIPFTYDELSPSAQSKTDKLILRQTKSSS